ncbi:MAG: D-alanyl-D-alanine carboxypeptidase [Oscillospiraceae bacterium]|nr:D-alanyl-D-alanine carboxypeptidase [Oscillospiraceae bacterium]
MAAAVLAAILFLLIPASAHPLLSAEKAILMDADTGRVIAEKNADSRALIASTTKIMTALLICECCDLNAEVCVPQEAVGIEGSSMYLAEGECLCIEELLYGLMLVSGNDAAVALAIACDGSEEAFVARMNARAASLGLSETAYGNPHGLDHENNYSTARDLAKLTAVAIKNEDFRRIASCESISFGARSMQNHNKLLRTYDGAIGVKTGYTKAAGRILVSAAERGGRTLVAVTLNDPDDWNDHTALLDHGFSRYKKETLVTEGETLAVLPLAGSGCTSVSAVASRSLSLPLAAEERLHMELRVPKPAYAPVCAGGYAGEALFYVDGAQIAAIPLEFAADEED